MVHPSSSLCADRNLHGGNAHGNNIRWWIFGIKLIHTSGDVCHRCDNSKPKSHVVSGGSLPQRLALKLYRTLSLLIGLFTLLQWQSCYATVILLQQDQVVRDTGSSAIVAMVLCRVVAYLLSMQHDWLRLEKSFFLCITFAVRVKGLMIDKKISICELPARKIHSHWVRAFILFSYCGTEIFDCFTVDAEWFFTDHPVDSEYIAPQWNLH